MIKSPMKTVLPGDYDEVVTALQVILHAIDLEAL